MLGNAAGVGYVEGTRVMARRDGIARLLITITQGDAIVKSVTHLSVAVRGPRHLDVLPCLDPMAHPHPNMCRFLIVGHDPGTLGEFCLDESPWTRARKPEVVVIDGPEVCVFGSDSARTGRVSVSGTGTETGEVTRESGDGGAVACVQHHEGHLCQNVDIVLARRAGDVFALAGAVEVACRTGGRTDVCPSPFLVGAPMAVVVVGPCRGRGLCPRGARREPRYPCDDAHPVDDGRETWACRGGNLPRAGGHIAAGAFCRLEGSERASGALRMAEAPLA